MRNVFLLYMPPKNAEAMVHYAETIEKKVELEAIGKFVSIELRNRLMTVFGRNRVAVWGSASGKMNQAFFDRMSEGDDLLIVVGDSIRLIGKVAAKTRNPDLSRALWKPLGVDPERSWELIYFIANPRELDVPFSEFCRLFGYAEHHQLRGFTGVSQDKLDAFFDRYDDLYSILVKLQAGEPIAEKPKQPESTLIKQDQNDLLVEIAPEDVDQVLRSELVSDHVKMQWKLASLGIKAGERVWVPSSDQGKLRKLYEFEAFDAQFAAGIDLPHSYVENIDVVWKQEFRIDAAYEIENSTAIYSGLLRFSDLMILAPNTMYPMFIVAPAERRGRVRDQLRRPTFKQLRLNDKVRFLPYEAVDEIDRFFANSATGLSVDLVNGKAERLT